MIDVDQSDDSVRFIGSLMCPLFFQYFVTLARTVLGLSYRGGQIGARKSSEEGN